MTRHVDLGAFLLLSCVTASNARPSPTASKLELPFISAGQPDPWGVVARTADRLAIRALLADRKFEELTKVVEGFQSYAESDCANELVGLDAFEAFQSADPALEETLTDWVRAVPDSYAPLVARGAYRSEMAQAKRGTGFANQTTAKQWTDLRLFAAMSRADLDASIVRHPTLAARRALMDLNRMTSTRETEGSSQLDLALQQCPSSLMMNMKALVGLTPRWGGSAEQMSAFVAKLPVEKNPRLKALAGKYEDDLGTLAWGRPEAIAHFERAIAAGPYWEYLFDEALGLLRLGRYQEALIFADKAALQRPQKPRIHVVRWAALKALGRAEEARAARDLVMRLNAFDSFIADLIGH